MAFRRAILLSVLVLGLASTGSALSEATFDGDLDIVVDEEEFAPGDTVTIDIEAYNHDAYPIADGYILLEMNHGCAEPTYPSQLYSCDTVFDEVFVDDVLIGQEGTEEMTVEYTLPENLREGTYRVDAYFRTNRTPVNGIPHIYLGAAYDSFEVTTGNGERPVLEIDRESTVFQGYQDPVEGWSPTADMFVGTGWPWIAGPVGVFVTEDMDEVRGQVYIEHEGTTTKDAELQLLVCGWDDTNCRGAVDERVQNVALDPGTNQIDVNVDAPDTPGAYAVRMELVHDGETHSIYRNRIIAEGNTAIIRLLAPDQPYYNNEEMTVDLTVGSSPDHYTAPVLDGATAHITVTDLDDDTVVLEDEQDIAELEYLAQDFDQLTVDEYIDRELDHFHVHAEILQNDKMYDEYEYEIDASDFAADVDDIDLVDYRYADGSMELEICGESSAGVPAETDVQVILFDDGDTASDGTVQLDGCGTYTHRPVTETVYDLEVNADEQYRFAVDATDIFPDRTLQLAALAGVLLLLIGGAVMYRRRSRTDTGRDGIRQGRQTGQRPERKQPGQQEPEVRR